MHTVVAGQDSPAGVDDGSGSYADTGAEEGLGVTGRDEADVMAVRLLAVTGPRGRRLADRRLWVSPIGNSACRNCSAIRTART